MLTYVDGHVGMRTRPDQIDRSRDTSDPIPYTSSHNLPVTYKIMGPSFGTFSLPKTVISRKKLVRQFLASERMV